jgi:V8-like Glu-specific endopeptidase
VILNNEKKLESISSRTNKPISLNQLKKNTPESIEDANSGRNSNYEDPSKDFTESDTKSFSKVSETKPESQSTPGILSELQKERKLQDVYFAKFDEPSTDQILRVIGPDDREIVTDTSQYPYSCICKLYITPKVGNKRYIGTGVYIGPNCVLTAAHCVYLHNKGGWASQIEVVPGLNIEPNRPFGSTQSNDFYCPNLYLEKPTDEKRQPYDFAAIITPRAFGDEVGYIGFSSLTDQEFENLLITISGYSGDKPDNAPGEAQSKDTKKISDTTDTLLIYELDTEGGGSGSPVITQRNNKIYACGIHNIGGNSFNSGTRITDGIHAKIKEWKNLQFSS